MLVSGGVYSLVFWEDGYWKGFAWRQSMAGKLHEDVARERSTSRIQGVLRKRVAILTLPSLAPVSI